MKNDPNYDPEFVMPDAVANEGVDALISRKDDIDEAVDVFTSSPFSLNVCQAAGLALVAIIGVAVLLAIYG